MIQIFAVLSAFENKNRFTIKPWQMCDVIRSVYSTLFQLTHFNRLQKLFIFALHHSYLRHIRSMDSVWKVIWLMNRLCIYPKDIQIITGRSDRYGRNLIKKIKEHFKKQQHQVVTVEEFCQYMGLQQDTVTRQLR